MRPELSLLVSVFVIGLVGTSPAVAQRPRPPRDRRVDSLLARMTLEEKLGQLNLPSVDNPASAAQLDLVRKGRVGGFLNLTGAAATHDAQRVAVTESRLHIPLLLGYDAIHGYRTTFPIPLAEASTWDPEVVEAAAHVVAREAAVAGVNWTFAPMVDIARDPRWGRIAEGSGEDPYLGSAMAAARVRGFQGTDVHAPDAVLATAKHFAAYGGAEGGRDYNTVDLYERTLREIYLPPFRAAVDAGVGSIMTSFNEISGTPSHANRWLVTTLLRGEWAYRGFVVSDWTGIAELLAHGVAGTRAEAGQRALDAGVDMDMVSGIYLDDVPALVRAGRVPMATIDAAVRRVLQAKAALGLFDDPYHGSTEERERGVLLAPEHRELARRVAREAIVLLKNDGGLLPLAPTRHTLAVIGPLADDPAAALGAWSGHGDPRDAVTALAGIKARAGANVEVRYARGAGVTDTATAGFAEAAALARGADLALLVLGEAADMSGEAASRSDLGLPGVQEQLLEAAQATGTPVVLVLMSGRPLTVAWAAEHVPAIVQAWALGVESGHALADVLFGDVSPSGRLPVTVPRTVGQVPIYYNHKNTGRPPADVKWTSKYIDLPSTPLFPFGHGLSYTTFDYKDLRLSAGTISRAETLRVSVTVTNTGTREATDVVQLYVHDEVASITRPVRQLAGFRRVPLKPGEARTITFALGPHELGFWDRDMRFRVEPGRFRVFVGASSVGGIEGGFEVK
ncbi:MAG TPA: glycoside hydrolase family 3 N-terminal domain-containing protein [Gemmatimonadales bacterium]|nr:glycoside hydrolase family 3 N-terminal domain-containing protein [Gemmatimonadales bacterium]